MTYSPKSIKEVFNWFPFLDIMEYTSYKIDNEIALLTSLLNMFLMYQMRFWYDKEQDDQNNVENLAIRCSTCGK